MDQAAHGDAPFRWLVVAILVATVAVSGFYRRRARREETIPRRAESAALRWARVAVTLPLLLALVAYAVDPRLMAWSALPLPAWLRWLGVGLAAAALPLAAWTLHTLGPNVSETVLTKSRHQLVTTGPYRRLRHPLYSVGLLSLAGLSLTAANAAMAVFVAATWILLLLVVVPREEAELERKFGEPYRAYQRRTGLLLPRRRRQPEE